MSRQLGGVRFDLGAYDVVVVGAGPAGSAAAHHLAAAGADVLLLERSAFPRDKVCGDGLTPRAVRELVAMGVPTDPADGWQRTLGLRLVGGGRSYEFPWPQLSGFPDHGLVRSRHDLDELLGGGDLHEVPRRAPDAQGGAVGEREAVADGEPAEDGGRHAGSVPMTTLAAPSTFSPAHVTSRVTVTLPTSAAVTLPAS